MPHNRKQRRQNTSVIESSPSSSQNPTPAPPSTKGSKSKSRQTNDIQDKEHDSPTSRENLITPTSTQPPSGLNRQGSDAEELRRAQRVTRNALSSSYKSYLLPKLSEQLDKNNRRMIAYPCKMCGIKIHHPTSDSLCSNLIKHAANCLRKQTEPKVNQNLATCGVKGTGDIDSKEVPQLCAVWCAEAARPFSALVDASHWAILHPTVVNNLPARQTVSKDIHQLYSAIQQNYKSVLEAQNGALYLGVDAWQSPNGFDILGIVIYRLIDDESEYPKLEAMPLDFIRFSQSHTGEYLAKMVCLVVEKFGIRDKICGIVSNNATNNKVMVKELKKQKWARFKQEPHWVHCFAHMLNLIVQGILRPFGTVKQSTTEDKLATTGDNSDDSDSGDEDNSGSERNINFFLPENNTSSGSEDDDGSEVDPLERNDPEEQLSLGDIENASEEDESDRYTTDQCKKTLAKFCAISKKLKYPPNSRAKFINICGEQGCQTPHNIEKDEQTRWNSTLVQINSIIRCEAAIVVWQRHKQHGIKQKFYLNQSDFELARDLAEVLNLFYNITQQILIAGYAWLANTVVFINQITEHLSTAISGSKYPPALKNACRIGLQITNKYYSLTDASPLYRIAIVLHPSFWDKYFKLVNWEPEWISEAVRLMREMWVNYYKPAPIAAAPLSLLTNSSKPKTSILAGLGDAAAARGGQCSTDQLDLWLAGGLILENGDPVNPLKW
ncbi:hypothetical protein PTTG_29443 [Puccinia triticina 1-1 BBBD Race 1]|uniref:DUF659 domain-containing protein n=1 Tax=Puccinia triticina (isolate 1-1 / race 1 (BBBD)) TaxID=630390 RepID=A0A180G4M8_PUCT1|nr:hypothetical protein PTTG_29443 [Puccinia triticina 1-1 BBBD Race 1]